MSGYTYDQIADRDTFKWYCGKHTGFTSWLRKVDRILMQRLGLGVFDLRDACWRDMYDDEISPTEAAQDILDNPYDWI